MRRGKFLKFLHREANQKAIDLLSSLADGKILTDEQCQILTGYIDEGALVAWYLMAYHKRNFSKVRNS
ncbi:hypothetical protein CHI19_09675 [Escherichia coli]|nr:hypothetical protein CHI19_09675 [Escherichia coli]